MFNRKVSDNAVAILWVTAGTALFTFVFASGKFAGDTASPLQILFLRYVGGLITLVAVVWRFGDSFKSYRSDKPSSHMVRAFFGAFGGGAAIYAAANMPIVDATAIGLLQAVHGGARDHDLRRPRHAKALDRHCAVLLRRGHCRRIERRVPIDRIYLPGAGVSGVTRRRPDRP